MKKTRILMAVTLLFFVMNVPQTVTAYSGPGGVKIHGFVSQGYLYSTEYNYLAHNTKDTHGGSFEFSEMGINFSQPLTDRLRVGIQFFARDVGDAGNNTINLDWAYGDYRLTNWLGIRAGKIKNPLGFYNETRDIDMLRTCIVLPQGAYNDLLRDDTISINGGGLYGTVSMGRLGDLNYQGLAGSLNSDAEAGTGKYLENTFYSDGAIRTRGEVSGATANNEGTTIAVTWDTPLSGLRLGFSRFDVTSINYVTITAIDFDVSQDRIIEGRTTFQYYSAEFTWNNLIVAAEYKQQESDAVVINPDDAADVDTPHVVRETYYLMASYRFTDLFTLGAYYSEFYPDMYDKEGDDFVGIDHTAWEKDLALTLRFDINDYCVFKIEGHSVNGTANVLLIDNTSSDFDEEDWYYGAAKVTVSF